MLRVGNSKIFYFEPGIPGEMIQFDELIFFKMGWKAPTSKESLEFLSLFNGDLQEGGPAFNVASWRGNFFGLRDA